MNNKSIGIIGGYGAVGVEALQYLVKTTDYRVVVAGRNKKSAKAVTEGMGRRVTSKVVDIYDKKSLDDFCRDNCIVLNCTGPSAVVQDRVALAAIRQSIHYVDPGGYNFLYKILEEKENEIKSKGLKFVISAGLFPGLSEVFPAYIAKTQFESVDYLELYYVGHDRWTYNSAYDIASSLKEIENYGFVCFDNGRIKKLGKVSGIKKIKLPPPLRSVRAFPFFPPEILQVVQKYGIKSAQAYGTNSGIFVPLAMFYIMLFRQYKTQKQKERSAMLIAKAAELDLKKRNPYFIVYLIIEGRMAGKKRRIVSKLIFEDTYKPTGLSLAITARLILEGASERAGRFLLPEGVNIEKFMFLLEEESFYPEILERS